MRTILAACIIAVTTAVPSPCAAGEDAWPVLKSPEARAATRKYEDSVKKLDSQFRAATQRMRTTYGEEVGQLRKACSEVLQKAQTAATKANDLDEALKVRSVAERLKNLPVQPPGVTADTGESSAEIAELNAEIARLKKVIETQAPEQPTSLEKALPGTQWYRPKDRDYWFFEENGNARTSDGLTGRWIVIDEHTIALKWKSMFAVRFAADMRSGIAIMGDMEKHALTRTR